MDSSVALDTPLFLTAHQLRTLIRAARGGFAPDHVARTLRSRRTVIPNGEEGEIILLLTGLIETASERLNDAGIESLKGGEFAQTLRQNEREYVENLCSLLSLRAIAECTRGEWEQGLASAQTGLAWCTTIDSPSAEVELYRAVAESWHIPGEFEKEEEARGRVLAAAERSGQPLVIIQALAELCSYLVAHMRLEEGEKVNRKGFELMEKEPVENRGWLYPSLLLDRGRLETHHARYADGLKTLREALRWADPEASPEIRASILSIIGGVYLQLEDFREAIRCLHESVELGDRMGMENARGWGCFGLSEAYTLLGDLDSADEMLVRARSTRTSRTDVLLDLSIDHKRSELLARRDRDQEAIALERTVVERIGTRELPDMLMVSCRLLGDLEKRRENYEEAERWYRRAIEVCDASFPARTPALCVSLAHALILLDRDEEASRVLDAVTTPRSLIGNVRHRAVHLRALLAERRNDFHAALEYEREATAIEREMLNRKREEGMQKTRIVAEVSLLEREADFERERRARVEQELAGAVVALGERKRVIQEIETRICSALAETHNDADLASSLRSLVGELRTQANGADSPLRYMSGVDQEFYARLRQGWPDLTPKQEKLCGLIRAGLGSREIGILLGVGTEGLKAQRKRLRKRFNLQPEEKLETLIAGV